MLVKPHATTVVLTPKGESDHSERSTLLSNMCIQSRLARLKSQIREICFMSLVHFVGVRSGDVLFRVQNRCILHSEQVDLEGVLSKTFSQR